MLFVYVYFTDGLETWAECYLQSFKFHNGSSIPIVAETRDLSEQSVQRLMGLYPNLELRNTLNMDALASLARQPVEVLRRWKDEVEHEVTTDENYPWKLLMSVEERYRSLGPIFSEYTQRGFTRMLHTDIDVYFRRGLGQLDDLISENDACIYFRRKRGLLGRRESGEIRDIWGGMLGVNATEGAIAFLDDWKARIERVPCPDRPRGFGQHTLLDSYRAMADQLRWGDLAQDPRALSVAKTDNSDPHATPDADVWIGNSNAGRNRKDFSVKHFLEDLERMKNGGHPRDENSSPRNSAYRAGVEKFGKLKLDDGKKIKRSWSWWRRIANRTKRDNPITVPETSGAEENPNRVLPSIIYSRAQPSPHYEFLIDMYREMHDQGYNKNIDGETLRTDAQLAFPGKKVLKYAAIIKELAQEYDARSCLDYGAGKAQYHETDIVLKLGSEERVFKGLKEYWGVDQVLRYEPGLNDSIGEQPVDFVFSTDVLEHCYLADIPWIVDEMFALSRKFVFANITCYPAKARLPNGEGVHTTVRPAEWWCGVFEATANRYPGIDYCLTCVVRKPNGKRATRIFRRPRFETEASRATRFCR